MDQQERTSVSRPPGARSAETPTSAALDRVQAVTNRIGAGGPPSGPSAPTGPATGHGQEPAMAETDVDGDGEVTADQVLSALALLRKLRAELESWEPQLIAAARQRGASWADLAPALGVASRQAAERRYLRLRPTVDDTPQQTRDDRVRAERDRRAGERAVARWASDNGADLRQLAGQITALTDLAPAARPSLDRLHDALGGPDPAALVRLLSDTQPHLLADHQALADRVDAMNLRVDAVRQDGRDRRTSNSRD
ncbi:hypothetical protein ACFP2T_11495 [Plantactinospora solaniradicis]|uniref:HSP18 transcriptional regulator n=1 Tax=Plantactinospora solaniradicis TaxID=1723736 RepID=A0ABW1K716_9ACTN